MQRNILVLLGLTLGLLNSISGRYTTGDCPPVDRISELDIQRYFGKWYEQYRGGLFQPEGQICTTANYSQREDGTIKVINRGINPNGKIGGAEGTLTCKNSSNCEVKFFWYAPAGPYWVLDTDYENYTVVYTCSSYVGILRLDNIWILARTPEIQVDVQKIFSFIEERVPDYPLTELKKTNQTNCAYE
ncbi:apolipoprotein d [Stylonychia lemnae]|uniref:Apolipoprotein d n=1 Tax=Stylonychia lemnae TaxID=5949 RepID=A0A078ADF7_STYLE|nr:apolipoprotein d [Stylonychia lemnae]|eukprot:CDW78878.1 apolipoprotein d [Stylonychia lemnae]